MKQRVISILMVLVMAMSLLTGCSKEPLANGYFDALNKMCSVKTGTISAEMSISLQDTVLSDVEQNQGVDAEFNKLFLNDEGMATASFKLESTVESEKRASLKISVKMGKEKEYKDLTTMIVYDNKLYISFAPIAEFVKNINAEYGTYVDQIMAAYAITDYACINLEQLGQALGQDITAGSLNEDLVKMMEKAVTSLDKKFADITSKDGNTFALKVNSDNAGKAIDAIVSILEDNPEKVIDSLITALEKSDSTKAVAEQLKDAKEDALSGIASAAQYMKDSKEDTISKFKEKDFSINSTVKLSEKKDNLNGVWKTTEVAKEDGKEILNVNSNMEVKEGKQTIELGDASKAVDLTSILMTFGNLYSDDSGLLE